MKSHDEGTHPNMYYKCFLLTLVVCAGGFGVVIATVVMVKCLFLILSSFVVSI